MKNVLKSHEEIAASGVLTFRQTAGKCVRFSGIILKGTFTIKVGSTTLMTLISTEVVPIDQEFCVDLSEGDITLNNTGSDKVQIYNLRVDQ